MREVRSSEEERLSVNWRGGRCQSRVVLRVEDWVRCLAFDLESDLLAVGTYGGAVIVAQLASGETVTTLEGLGSEVTALAFDSERILAGGIDGSVALWRREGGRGAAWAGGLLGQLAGPCTGVHLGSDSAAAVSSVRGQVKVWGAGGAADCSTHEIGRAISCCAVGAGYAFAGLRDGRVLVFRPDGPGGLFDRSDVEPTPILSFIASFTEITAITVAPASDSAGGGLLYAGAADGIIKRHGAAPSVPRSLLSLPCTHACAPHFQLGH